MTTERSEEMAAWPWWQARRLRYNLALGAAGLAYALGFWGSIALPFAFPAIVLAALIGAPD